MLGRGRSTGTVKVKLWKFIFPLISSSRPGLPRAHNPPLHQMYLPAASFEESSGDFTAGRWCQSWCNEKGPNGGFLRPPSVGQSLHVCCCWNMRYTLALHIRVKARAAEVTVWARQGVRKQSGLINPCWSLISCYRCSGAVGHYSAPELHRSELKNVTGWNPEMI